MDVAPNLDRASRDLGRNNVNDRDGSPEREVRIRRSRAGRRILLLAADG
jgi:hypothetical protein